MGDALVTAEPRNDPGMIRVGSDNGRRPVLAPVPTDAERDAFEAFLARWLADAAERRMRRSAGR